MIDNEYYNKEFDFFGFNNSFYMDFEEYENYYENCLSYFLKAYKDNSERYFIAEQKEKCNKHILEIKESLKGIEFYSDDRETYLDFFINRILPYNPDKYSLKRKCSEFARSEQGKKEDYVSELKCVLRNRNSTNYKILSFLDTRLKTLQQDNKETDTRLKTGLSALEAAYYAFYLIQTGVIDITVRKEDLYKEVSNDTGGSNPKNIQINYNNILKDKNKRINGRSKKIQKVIDFLKEQEPYPEKAIQLAEKELKTSF